MSMNDAERNKLRAKLYERVSLQKLVLIVGWLLR